MPVAAVENARPPSMQMQRIEIPFQRAVAAATATNPQLPLSVSPFAATPPHPASSLLLFVAI